MSDKQIEGIKIKTGLDTDIYAEISADGELIKFDNKLCRELAERDNSAVAVMCVVLLEKVASEVDHIRKEGGGTYGDFIRNLSVG